MLSNNEAHNYLRAVNLRHVRNYNHSRRFAAPDSRADSPAPRTLIRGFSEHSSR